MKKALFIGLAVMLFAAGCAAEETVPTPTPSATSSSVSTPAPSPATSPAPASTPTPRPATFFLQVLQPDDGSVIATETVGLIGVTMPGAVVSISLDGEIEIADVDDGGQFSANVVLADGPNYIEVVASDQTGNQVYTTLVVVYSP